jgi:hypothetical protein
MQETIALICEILFISVLLFFLCAFIGLLAAHISKDHNSLKRRFSLLNPIYYLLYSVIFFCFIIRVFMERHFDWMDALIFIALTVIMISGIKAYKLSKHERFFPRFKSLLWKNYLGIVLVSLVVILNVLSVH